MGNSLAIVVGINGYDRLRPLKYAKQDALKIKEFLEEHREVQSVLLFTDDSDAIDGRPTRATHTNLRDLLVSRFNQKFLSPEDNLWFFFSGHGLRHGQHDYLIPIDGNPRDVDGTCITVDFVTKRLSGSGAGNIVLILDACRNVSEGGKAGGEALGEEATERIRERGLISIFACRPEEQSWEEDALGHGIFTFALLKSLEEANCATVRQINSYLRLAVPALAERYGKLSQTPWMVAEPIEKADLVLSLKNVKKADLDGLKKTALEAEVADNYDSALELWNRVNIASHGRDNQCFEAVRRIELKRYMAARRQQEEQERFEAAQRQRDEAQARQRAEKEQLEAEKREKERLQAEQREKERLEAEERQREEQKRLAAEQRENERLEAEQREKERIAAEQREKERLATEQREKERLEAAQHEKERLEAERREKERLEAERRQREEAEAREGAEKRENERLAAEQRQREEKERREAKRQAEQERLDAEYSQRKKYILPPSSVPAKNRLPRWLCHERIGKCTNSVGCTLAYTDQKITLFTKEFRCPECGLPLESLGPKRTLPRTMVFSIGVVLVLILAVGAILWALSSSPKRLELSRTPPPTAPATPRPTAPATLETSLAEVYFNMGLHESSLREKIIDYTKAIMLNPNDAAAYAWRGNAYRDTRDYDKSIGDYSEAVRLDPNYAFAYNNRGNSYYDKREYDKAISDYTKAIWLNPDYPSAYYNRSLALRAQGKNAQAQSDFDKAKQLGYTGPQSTPAPTPTPDAAFYNSRGWDFYQKKDYDNAISDYNESIRLEPSYLAYIERGDTYLAKTDYDNAISDYTKAAQLKLFDAQPYNKRGVAYLAKKDYDKAISDFSEAITLNPDDGIAYFNRGKAFEAQGKKTLAQGDFNKAASVGFYKSK